MNTKEPYPELTIANLLAVSGEAVIDALPRMVWVTGASVACQIRRSGFSIELVEAAGDNTSTAAGLRVYVQAGTARQIEADHALPFTPESLTGVELRILVAPTWHQRHQMGARLIAIDPARNPGLLARRDEAVRARLRTQGLFDAQKSFRAPPDISGIAIICPAHSAALTDITPMLDRISDLVEIRVLEASFEGRSATEELVRALDRASDLGWSGQIDVVLLVRGGGATAGLAAIATFEVARAICVCSVPVITGIGHGRDRSILDEVAWHAAATPSLAARVVLRILRRRADDVFQSYQSIMAIVGRREAVTREVAEKAKSRLFESVARRLRDEEARLRACQLSLIRDLGTSRVAEANAFLNLKSIIATAAKRARDHIARADIVVRERRNVTMSDCRQAITIADTLLVPSSLLADLISSRLRSSVEGLGNVKADHRDRVKQTLADAGLALERLREFIQTRDVNEMLQHGFALVRVGLRLIVTAADARSTKRFWIQFQDESVRVEVCPCQKKDYWNE